MNINYVLTDKKEPLFSFSRHDYKEKDGAFIDGGFDYIRTNRVIYSDSIDNMIPYIRMSFMWTSNYDINKNKIPPKEVLLMDLEESHINNILVHLREREINHNNKYYEYIFKTELAYRKIIN